MISVSNFPKVIESDVRSSHRDLFNDAPESMKANVAAELIGVSPKTMIRHIKNGNVPGFKIGRFYFVTKPALIEFVANGGCL